MILNNGLICYVLKISWILNVIDLFQATPQPTTYPALLISPITNYYTGAEIKQSMLHNYISMLACIHSWH